MGLPRGRGRGSRGLGIVNDRTLDRGQFRRPRRIGGETMARGPDLDMLCWHERASRGFGGVFVQVVARPLPALPEAPLFFLEHSPVPKNHHTIEHGWRGDTRAPSILVPSVERFIFAVRPDIRIEYPVMLT